MRRTALLFVVLLPSFVVAARSAAPAATNQPLMATPSTYTGGYSWVKGVLTQVGPYARVKDISERVPSSDLAVYDAGSFASWIEREFCSSQPDMTGGERDILFKALDVAAAMTVANDFAPLRRCWLQADTETIRQLSTAPRPGLLTIYKLYNEGVILRTPEVCLGIDLYLHPAVTEAQIQELAGHLDGLLVTHDHSDHKTSALETCLRQLNKPIHHAMQGSNQPPGAKIDAGAVRGASWTSFGGQHGSKVFSGFYVAKIGSWRILHSGDNVVWNEASFSSDDARGIDIAFMKLETPAVVGRVKPRILVPHHLLELGHGLRAYGHDELGVRHRNPGKNAPALLMLQWGDRYEVAQFK
jgi:hypothetical protein